MEKSKIFGILFSILDQILVINLSLTKVNPHFKNDSATLDLSKIYEKCNKRIEGKTIVIGMNESTYLDITYKANIITEGNLNIIQDITYLGNIKFKCGNPGKVIKMNTWISHDSTLNVKDQTILLLYLYVIKIYIAKFISNTYANLTKQAYVLVHGGKKNEKANALRNGRDISNIQWNGLNRSWPINERYIGQKQNSWNLNKAFQINRYFSTVREESEAILVKRQLVESNMLKWPSAKDLGIIHEEVFKQQMKLVKLAETHGYKSDQVRKLQEILVNSLFFRIAAIHKLSRSKGSQTPGIDNISLTSRKEDKDLYKKLVQWLKDIIKNPKTYKATPVKRVWIPKPNGKPRPLGIPSLKDRALQHLINLILEPLVESTNDANNYGFRKHRSAKNAIGLMRAQLRTKNEAKNIKNMSESNKLNNLSTLLPERKVILDADIKGFFDNINHAWILENVYIPNKYLNILDSWLTSGAIEKGVFIKTEKGTPQGGIISPTLANLTLNGLEKTVLDSILPLTRSKERRLVVKLKDNSKTRIASNLACIRYADDFVVFARSKYLMDNYIIPSINAFMKARGLELNVEKTKIIRLTDPGTELNFLGYTFKFQQKWRSKQGVFWTDHAASKGIALYPNKNKTLGMIRKLKEIFKTSQNLDAYNLIANLNPIIRGWANYFNIGNSSRYRDTVRNALYHLVWKWAHHKHRKWGKKRIAATYFLNPIYDETEKSKVVEYNKFKRTKWTFHGKVNEKSRYNPETFKKIHLVNITTISQLISSKFYIIPKNLEHVHAYHPDYMKLIDFNANVNLKTMGTNSSFREKLLKKQNHLCDHCGLLLHSSIIDSEQYLGENLHIHHKVPINKGGATNKIKNMALIHIWCHKDVHKTYEE
jgi:RNA-directed DNA polymerase